MRLRILVALAVATLSLSCSNGDQPVSAWCGAVAEGAVVPLDAADAPARWSELEELAPDDLHDAVERLRVAAYQVAALAPDDLEGASRLLLTPRVTEAHSAVVSAVERRCQIDVATLTIIDPR